MHARPALAMVAALAVVAALTGCSSTVTTTTPAPAPPASASAPLTVTDPWVKAASSGMSAAFGTIANPGTSEITVVSASTAAAQKVELHQTVMVDGSMQMMPKPGGFAIPAGGTLILEPGGNHLMLMGLTAPLTSGDEVAIMLTLSSGATLAFTATVKEFSGANESYHASPSTSMS